MFPETLFWVSKNAVPLFKKTIKWSPTALGLCAKERLDEMILLACQIMVTLLQAINFGPNVDLAYLYVRHTT